MYSKETTKAKSREKTTGERRTECPRTAGQLQTCNIPAMGTPEEREEGTAAVLEANYC